MEELFEVVIAIATIAIALIKVAGNAKKVKKNAPGQTGTPVAPTAAAPVKPTAAQPTVRPTVAPTVRPAQPMRSTQPSVQPVQPARTETKVPGGVQQTFWQQIGDVLREVSPEEKGAKGHEAVSAMAEGDSRECEHGSVGGSMAYESHQGGRITADRPLAKREEPQAAVSPALTAEEMRRAVVMAEVLKRPQERMAEQARRWAAR